MQSFHIRSAASLLILLCLFIAGCTRDDDSFDVIRYGGLPISPEPSDLVVARLTDHIVSVEWFSPAGDLEARLQLIHVSDGLPTAPAFAEIRGEDVLPMRSGTVAIQDWDISTLGPISGEVKGRLRRPLGAHAFRVFYVDSVLSVSPAAFDR